MTTQSNIQSSTAREAESPSKRPVTNVVLWTIQVLLAALFIFAGATKLVMSTEAMAKMAMPVLFLRFIGVAELLGGIGLILPWLLGIRRELTPLAALGLLIIMIGATVLTLSGGSIGAAVVPFITGILLLIVAYGRWSSLRSS
jgi:uncharacterized membrane protein YphA (DoxX/SURF4 family)